MRTRYKLGVDGSGPLTECLATDDRDRIIARYTAPACHPAVVGASRAREILIEALGTLLVRVGASYGPEFTLLCMAGPRDFWRDTARQLSALPAFGRVRAVDDAWPLLELATHGHRGLVLHSGHGSYIAARTPDGTIHHAGGLGWRFGDPGSAYDIGRRGIARGLLDLQTWAAPSPLAAELQAHTGAAEPGAISRYFYEAPAPERRISAFASGVLRLAAEGDHAAHSVLLASVSELLSLAHDVADRLFTLSVRSRLRTGVSGPILTHATVLAALRVRTQLPLVPITEDTAEGVRRLLSRQR